MAMSTPAGAEIMVVMVIIGIAAAAISINMSPDPAENLRQDARELALRLTTARGRLIGDLPTGAMTAIPARSSSTTSRCWKVVA